MPTHCNETLQQRYQRERDDYLKALAKYTPEQIAAVEVDLHNAAATIAQLRAVLRGLVDDIQGLIAESDGVAGLHRNGDVAPWGELEAGGQFERLSHLPAAIEALQCSEVRKCSEQCAEHGALTDEGSKQAAGRDLIREVFMANGFSIKEGQIDLKPYVYEAAEALLRELSPAFADPMAWSNKVKLLASEYWDIAYQEGKTGANLADQANDVLRRLDAALLAKPVSVNQKLLAALKMVLDDQESLEGRPRTYECVMEAIAAAEAEQCKCQRLGDYDGHTHHMLCDAHNPPFAKPAASAQPVAVPDGFVLVQKNPDKAVCLDGGRFHGWLMYRHPDGQFVSERKLEPWELMQVEDQRDYEIVLDDQLSAAKKQEGL